MGHAGGKGTVVADDIFVAVPVATGEAVVAPGPDLNKPDATLEKAAGHKAFSAHGIDFLKVVDLLIKCGFAVVETVEPKHFLRFTAPIQRLGGRGLQTCGQFIGTQAGFQPAVAVS